MKRVKYEKALLIEGSLYHIRFGYFKIRIVYIKLPCSPFPFTCKFCYY
ncbi:hypothetical protein HMPREF0083_03033 [Aneurinibacillus aneurinilyticus ATCC 12856]|uniref:Uncharacterized protein n=1 Tax=Aneurinibacillus aneurinilyticus ATCC 12856 TaxID=649747 RepID=U1X2W3_ANEAE|nr:hypothetical protein HMPREF0083_03033 [Aneurinibacillus aneurinilyticus ATCC 12856]